jgi:C-terminal processing protease CtpA/Prc
LVAPLAHHQVAVHHAGDPVTLVVSRAGQKLVLPINLGSLKDTTEAAAPSASAFIGVQAGQAPAGRPAGVVITSVQPGYPAEAAGLVVGDTILDAGSVRVRNVVDFAAAITGKAGQEVFLSVRHASGTTQTVPVQPTGPPKGSAAAFDVTRV